MLHASRHLGSYRVSPFSLIKALSARGLSISKRPLSNVTHRNTTINTRFSTRKEMSMDPEISGNRPPQTEEKVKEGDASPQQSAERYYVKKEENDGVVISLGLGDSSTATSKETTDPENADPVTSSVLQYERQMRKIRARTLSTQTLTEEEHLRVIYSDPHIVVVDKPSGVLTVPGLNQNPCMLDLVHSKFGCDFSDKTKMIVHRLDMDTSGLVIFSRTTDALSKLHEHFRERRVNKVYEALVCGTPSFGSGEGRVELPLQRDHKCPPFMRVATPQSEQEAKDVVKGLNHIGWKKIVKKNPKKSVTGFKVLRSEILEKEFPSTRLELVPVTGRTHQLRVHCAAIGHPIVADPAYSLYGEASPNGGFQECQMDEMSPHRASLDLQLDILDNVVKRNKMNMCLHAKELGIPHPVTGEYMVFRAPPPF